jgi:hypothetical protein
VSARRISSAKPAMRLLSGLTCRFSAPADETLCECICFAAYEPSKSAGLFVHTRSRCATRPNVRSRGALNRAVENLFSGARRRSVRRRNVHCHPNGCRRSSHCYGARCSSGAGRCKSREARNKCRAAQSNRRCRLARGSRRGARRNLRAGRWMECESYSIRRDSSRRSENRKYWNRLAASRWAASY